MRPDVLGVADMAMPALTVIFPHDLPAGLDHIGLRVGDFRPFQPLGQQRFGQLANARLSLKVTLLAVRELSRTKMRPPNSTQSTAKSPCSEVSKPSTRSIPPQAASEPSKR